MKKVERQRALSLSPLLSREGQEKSSFQVRARAHTYTRAMMKRKKMRDLIVVARADRIYRSLLEGLRSTGRGKLPFAPTHETSVYRSVRTNYSDPTKFLIECDFLLSSKSRETSVIVVSPRHTLRNFHLVVRNVRSNEFRESVDLRATVQRH